MHAPPAIDVVFHALADPTRRAMVDRLSRGPASVSALGEPFAITLAAVVQHLQVLERSGIVRTEKVGRVRSCHLDVGALVTAEQWLAQRRATWERRLDRLGALLELDDEASEPAGAAPPRRRNDTKKRSNTP